jgi:NADPH:quinone reductase-like Zn-dependent oxidoreductase
MKVIELRNTFGIDSLVHFDRPEPKPGSGQVLVKMKAFSLNYRDLLMVKGIYNPKLRFPFTPLSDGAGEIVAVGEGVTRVRPGMRVASTFMQKWVSGQLTDAGARSALGGGTEGVAAEYVVLDAEGVTPVPEHLTDVEAATLPCAAVTAWNALVTQGQIKAGDTVLIQGTGGVSLFALQFAKLHGARVIATSSSDAKLERVRQLGASDGINYRTTPDWEEKVRALTGQGVDHVVEVGGAGTLAKSLRAVRGAGQISLIGVLAGNDGQINPVTILMKCVRVQGIFVGSREMFEAMNRAIALHQMRPIVDRVFPMSDIRAAMLHMESGAHFGKVCLQVG